MLASYIQIKTSSLGYFLEIIVLRREFKLTSVVYGMDITLRNKIPEISPERWVYRITLNSVRKESRNSEIQPKNYFVSQVKKKSEIDFICRWLLAST